MFLVAHGQRGQQNPFAQIVEIGWARQPETPQEPEQRGLCPSFPGLSPLGDLLRLKGGEIHDVSDGLHEVQPAVSFRPNLGAAAVMPGNWAVGIATRGALRQSCPMRWVSVLVMAWFFPTSGLAEPSSEPRLRPPEVARTGTIPRTRWEHRRDAALFTRSALSALKAHGAPLVGMVPRDVADWCPSYPQGDERRRRAFWVGFLSALAKHESTYDPRAVGGGGRWYGLLQILPSTARGYGCRAESGEALRHGPDNLSCAIRIMARTVPRDGVIAAGGGGVAADWGPLKSAEKRADMQGWLRAQSYCKPLSAVRPRARPDRLARVTD
jgi:hypothetical protein